MQEGEELYTVLAEDLLHRRCPANNPNFIKPDGTLTSGVFKKTRSDVDDSVSINIECLIQNVSATYNPATHRIATLQATHVFEEGCKVQHLPVVDNYAHGGIIGMTDGIARKLAKKSSIYVAVNEVS